MALADELLDQAIYLASIRPGQPNEASLRRAVSAAYYALFHLLTAAAASNMAPAFPAKLRPLVQRTFVHR